MQTVATIMATQNVGVSRSGSILQKFREDSTTNEELIDIYKAWSKTYDKDVQNDLGYLAPVSSAKLLSNKMEEFGFTLDSRILDLGSGTGLVGEALHKLGHNNIDALDVSQESLEVAKEKEVYKNIIRGFMASEKSQDLGVKANQYDAAICIGVFTGGHVRGEGFEDLVHSVKPGGLACFSIRDDVANDPKYGFNEKMEELLCKNKWKLVEKVKDLYCSTIKLGAWLYVYQML